jgi:hypothetical protein
MRNFIFGYYVEGVFEKFVEVVRTDVVWVIAEGGDPYAEMELATLRKRVDCGETQTHRDVSFWSTPCRF